MKWVDDVYFFNLIVVEHKHRIMIVIPPFLGHVMKTIQFYYDIVCPYAYMASQKIESIAKCNNSKIQWVPVLLGGIYKSLQSEQVPSASWAPSKAKLGLIDLEREARIQNIPLHKPKSHPQRSVNAQRLLCFASENVRSELTHDLYKAYWKHGEDITQEETLRKYARKYGILEDVWKKEEIKQKLFVHTNEVISKGGFGVPFVSVDNRYWWGQDRLHFLDAYLQNPTSVKHTYTTNYWPSFSQQSKNMPKPKIYFYHDFASPFSYLGSTQIENIAQRYGLEIEYKPILLGALFHKIGTPIVPIFAMSQAKQKYLMRDLQDWSDWWDVPFSFPKIFPMRTVTPLRASIVEPKIIPILYKSYWRDGRNIGDTEEFKNILEEHGFDAISIIEDCSKQEIKDLLFENGREAERYGICGVPSMRVKDEIWWGQDRLKSMILYLQEFSS